MSRSAVLFDHLVGRVTLWERKKDRMTWLFQLAVAEGSKYFLKYGFANTEHQGASAKAVTRSDSDMLTWSRHECCRTNSPSERE
jgi:hypothetical protein